MATVFLATESKHGRQVAVKVLRPELSHVLGPGRFLQEIEICARLAHPNIVPLLDSGTADGLPWYAMPYVEGATLRDLLAREPQLAVADAIRIACEVAAALQYAHEKGLVHRDIKPENILLGGGTAMVADFGIARALTRSASAQQLTSTGVSIGTPAYMSPEQGDSVREAIDGRADIYSLGCVLYEMLAGHPPFGGSDARTIIARHARDPVPPLTSARPSLPPAIEKVVLRALEKVPADRYATAAEFAADLRAAEADHGRRERPVAVRAALWLGAALVLGTAGWLTADRAAGRRDAAADTTTYAVVALDESGSLAASTDIEQRFHDALSRWVGLSAADRLQLRAALRPDSGRLDQEAVLRAARGAAAGRLVRLELSTVGDSTRVRAVLFDVVSGAQVKEVSRRLPRDLRGADASFAALADSLLLRESLALLRPAGTPPASLPALQGLLRGLAAVERWDLDLADSAFDAATRIDPAFAEAALWQSLVRWWRGDRASGWHSPAVRAQGNGAKLAARDRVLATALTEIARADYAAACARLRSLVNADRYDFVSRYALGTCLRRDAAVVPDRRSPSGWRFRSSRHEAYRAFREAFLLLPSMSRSVRTDRTVRAVLLPATNQLIQGKSLTADSAVFLAYAGWAGDSLVFVPFPSAEIAEGSPHTRPASMLTAVRQQRLAFQDVAAAWVAAAPASSDAMEALATALEATGNPASLDTLRRARVLAREPDDRFRLAATQVWLQLKFALPDDTVAVRAARALADSLLRGGERHAGDALAALAAVTGRASQLGRAYPADRLAGQRPEYLVPGTALVAFAALGGPADSIAALRARTEQAIAASEPAADRADDRRRYLTRAAELYFPHAAAPAPHVAAGQVGVLARAQTAYALGDSGRVLAMLDTLSRQRAASSGGPITLDVLLPEAWLLMRLGRIAEAARWLDGSLRALPETSPGILANDPAIAASLVHAMALRADLALAMGDTALARTWGRAVTMLWSDADEFLQPIVQRMRRIAR